MPAITTIIAALSAAAAIGGTAYEIKQGEDARSDQQNAANQAKQQADKAAADMKAKQDQDAAAKDAITTRDAQALKARILSSGAAGRGGTILTGPQGLGTTPAPATGNKQLLGS